MHLLRPKHKNNCPPTLQPGFEAWFANGGGTYYNPSFAVQNVDGLPDGPFKASASSRYGNYSTALIGNYSINWIKKVATEMKSGKDTRPFMAYIAPKACHDPFEPAPWYTDVWLPHWPATAPRPPSWNVSRAQLSKHHPTIAVRDHFGAETEACIDRDFKNRWRTLLSVDDIIVAVVGLLDETGLSNNTYFLYTSDVSGDRYEIDG